MSRLIVLQAIAAAINLVAASITTAYGDSSNSLGAPVSIPQSGVERHIIATKSELECIHEEGCSAVLVIDVHQFPETVNGLQIETRPSDAGTDTVSSEKHFKSHDGSGKFMLLLDKDELSKGYDLKIRPIYKSTVGDGQENTIVNNIKIEAIRNKAPVSDIDK